MLQALFDWIKTSIASAVSEGVRDGIKQAVGDASAGQVALDEEKPKRIANGLPAGRQGKKKTRTT